MEEDFDIEIAEDRSDTAHYAAFLSPINTPTDLPFALDASPTIFSPSNLFLTATVNRKQEEPIVNQTSEEELDVFEYHEEKQEMDGRAKKLEQINKRAIDEDFDDLWHDAHRITVSSSTRKKGSLKNKSSPTADKPKKKVIFAQENFEQKRVYVPDDDSEEELDDSIHETIHEPEIHIEESTEDKDDIQIVEDHQPKQQQQQAKPSSQDTTDDHLEIVEEDRYAVISKIEQEWEEVVKLREKRL